MNHIDPSNGRADVIDSGLDLENVFNHPDGLPTARYLVKHLAVAMKRHKDRAEMAMKGLLPFHVSQSVGEMNPEIPSIVKEVLTFREPQSQYQDARPLGTTSTTEFYDQREEVSDKSHIRLTPTFQTYEPLNRSQQDHNLETHSLVQQHGRPPHISQSSPASLRSPSLESSSSAGSDVDSYFGDDMEVDPSQQKLPPISQIEKPSASYRNPLTVNNPKQDGQRPPTMQEKPSFQPTNLRQPIHQQNPQGRIIHARPPNNVLAQSSASYSGLAPRPSLLPNRSNNLSVTYSPIQSYPQFNCQSIYNSNPPSLTNRKFTPILSNNHASKRSWTHIESRTPDFSPSNTLYRSLSADGIMPPKKRKNNSLGGDMVKKQKTDGKQKRAPKAKVDKKGSAKYQLDLDIWMRILEFTPPSFLGKARLISQSFKALVDAKSSIYQNCRKENFGYDMPAAPLGLTERQYTNLLGGKGCVAPGCDDKNAARTHWSWAKRWCMKCWKSKIEREDRVIKSRAQQWGRTTLERMLECVPVGMHDSFMKPHDIMDEVEDRGRNAPRLYKYFLTEDIDRIIAEYKALDPIEPDLNDTMTPEQKTTAQEAYQKLLDGLEDARTSFFADRKALNDEHMEQVKKIEAGIRMRRQTNATPYNNFRQARRDLFTKRASEEIGHIPTEFVQGTVAFKAATRIFRDGGTERGWQTLKPKIVQEWDASQNGDGQNTVASKGENANGEEEAEDAIAVVVAEGDEDHNPTPMELDGSQNDSNVDPPLNHGFESQSIDFQQLFNNQPTQPAQQMQQPQQMQQAQQMQQQKQMQQKQQTHQVQNTRQGQQIQQMQQAPRSGLALSNGFPSFHPVPRSMPTATVSNVSFSYGGPFGMTMDSLHQKSSVSSIMTNSASNLGRQTISFGNNMLSSNMFSGAATGNRASSYPQSYQFGSVNVNRGMSMNSAQDAIPSAKMSISHLIQQPEGNPFEDYDG